MPIKSVIRKEPKKRKKTIIRKNQIGQKSPKLQNFQRCEKNQKNQKAKESQKC